MTSPPQPHLSLLTSVHLANQCSRRSSHMRIPPGLGYHDNEHWSRQHLAVVRKEEVEGGTKAGGEAEREEEREEGR